jgi:isocitrate dehydrogenase kinase/phosphatase
VFPEQWLQFLSIPAALQEVFLQHHSEILTAAWWRAQRELCAQSVEAPPGRAPLQPERVPAQAV